MNRKKITISKTAQYFTLGEATKDVEQVWIVCHGYGQLANYFIKKFEILNNGKNLIVAPEALHRFYTTGFSGRVGASWMTKEERLDDINDYVNFIDAVYNEVIAQLKNKNVKINVLGFSQSTATVCRWLAQKNKRVDNLILWAGFFPHDIDFKTTSEIFNNINIQIMVGKQDEFITESEINKQINFLKENNIQFELTLFEGKHEIPEKILSKIAQELSSDLII